MSAATTPAPARAIRFVSIEPGRISLHGVALTDSEYAVLRGIAERMKLRNCAESQTGVSEETCS